VQVDPQTGQIIPQPGPLGEPEETVEVLTSDPRFG